MPLVRNITDPSRVEDAIRILVKNGLIKRSGIFVSMHLLTQTAFKHSAHGLLNCLQTYFDVATALVLKRLSQVC